MAVLPVAITLNLRFDKCEALKIDVANRCISVSNGASTLLRMGRTTVVRSADLLYVRIGKADSQLKNDAFRLVIRGEDGSLSSIGLWLSNRERREFAQLMGLRVAAALPGRRWTPPGLQDDPAIDVFPYEPSVADPPESRDPYWRALEEMARPAR